MINLIELVLKDFKILFRNKSSTLIFVLGPLLVVLMLGFAFNSADIYGLKLGVYSPVYNTLTDNLLSKLSSQFTIIKTATVQSCVDGVKLSDWHVCLVFPKNFDIKTNNNIDFYVNPTKINLVYIITNMISAKVGEETTEISKGLVEGLLNKMEVIKAEVDKDQQILSEINENTAAIRDRSSRLYDEIAKLNLSFNESGLQTDYIEEHFILLRQSALKIGSVRENISDSAVSSIVSNAYTNITTEIAIITSSLADLANAVNSTRTAIEDTSAMQVMAKTSLTMTLQQLSASLIKLNNLSSSMSLIQEEIVVGLDATGFVKPITSSIKEVTTEKRYIGFIFPILLVMMLMFGGIFFSSSLVISEKTSRAYFRNLIVPVRRITFVFASYITTMVMLTVEVGIVLGVVYFFTKTPINPELLGLLAIVASVFVFLGLLIGYISRNAEVSMLISIAVVALLLFFSNLILPVETIAYLRQIAVYNPFTIASNIIKENMLLSIGYRLQMKYIIVLFSYLAVAFVASLLAQQISKKHA